MATIRKTIITDAAPDSVWDAVRDIGALHERLVPGFVVATRVEADARVVTFGDGSVIREPIVALDEHERRLVWTAESGALTHYNASLQVLGEGTGSRVVWIADFLPDGAAARIDGMMEAGMVAMKNALDPKAPKAGP